MKSFIFFWILFFTQIIQSPEDLVLSLEKNMRSLRSLRADFIHVYYDTAVSDPLREKGLFTYREPDSLKWEYRDPEIKVWLYKQGEYRYYIPEDNQLYLGELSENAEEAEILHILTGRKSIIDSYIISFTSFPTGRKNVRQIKLVPKQEGEYSFILLEIIEKRHLISKVLFTDWAGNRSEFHFDDIKTNPRLGDDVFELKVPSGVEIIDNRSVPDKRESFETEKKRAKSTHLDN